jgi:hypothetical protein
MCMRLTRRRLLCHVFNVNLYLDLHNIRRPGPPGWGLGAGLTIQPRKKVIVMKPPKGEARARPGLWPYDDDDDDDDEYNR